MTISVAFELTAPMSTHGGRNHVVYGHTVHFSHCYPLTSVELSPEDYQAIIDDPEKKSHVRCAFQMINGNAVYLKGTSWK